MCTPHARRIFALFSYSCVRRHNSVISGIPIGLPDITRKVEFFGWFTQNIVDEGLIYSNGNVLIGEVSVFKATKDDLVPHPSIHCHAPILRHRCDLLYVLSPPFLPPPFSPHFTHGVHDFRASPLIRNATYFFEFHHPSLFYMPCRFD